MDKTPANTVTVDVLKVKDKPFYAVIGPGQTVLDARPMPDEHDPEGDMSTQEIYKEYENILMADKHIKNPEYYETVATYLSPDNMQMYAELDMRGKTVDEMKQAIIDSTRV